MALVPDERGTRRRSPVGEYVIGGVASLFILALLISAYSAFAG